MPKRSPTIAEPGDSGNDEPEFFDHPLLIEEPPLQVLPSLANALGLEEAIVVQQLHYLLRAPNHGRVIGGERWIFNTYEAWQKMFQWWSVRTVRRIFESLEASGIVLSCQPEGTMSRRKYYRLNRGVVHKLRSGSVPRVDHRLSNLATSSVQNGRIRNSPNWPLPSTKSTSESTCKKAKESEVTRADAHAGDFSVFPAEWKPTPGTKEQKLAIIQPPKYPSEMEFDAFLDTECLDTITTYRPDLYLELCTNKWHQWKERPQKWVPIRDWRKYVQALADKIDCF